MTRIAAALIALVACGDETARPMSSPEPVAAPAPIEPDEASPPVPAPPPRRIVLVVIDTLRADRLPPHGGPASAPFLSRLAAEGVVFDAAQSTSSWTAPATASLLTSLHPHQHGVITGYAMARRSRETATPIRPNRIPDGAETMAEALRAAGYRTFAASDNLNVCETMGFAAGFDRFASSEGRGADAVNEAVLAWRAEIAASERSFVYVHYFDPHRPYVAHAEWLDATLGDRSLAAYDSEIAFVDRSLAALLAALGADRDTLVVVTADHGEEFGDHGGTGHGNQLHGELVRVPLIVSWPAAFAARRVAAAVSLVDVLPTVRALAGSPPSARDAGRSLVPALRGDPLSAAAVFAMRTGELTMPPRVRQSAITDRWRYLRLTPEGVEALFDLHADPAERRNVAASERAVVSALRSELDELLASPSILPRAFGDPRTIEPEDAERLRALGYVQ
jgi:arylsulfatase A-like enzyme